MLRITHQGRTITELDASRLPTIVTGTCFDGLHEACPGGLMGNPCNCNCHHEEKPPMSKDYENYVPPSAKKPTDRKSKKKAAAPDAPSTVTVQGIELTIDPEVFDDFELMADIRALDRGDATSALVMPDVLKALVGPDQYRTVLNHLRGSNGRVGLEVGATFVMELFAAYDPNS